MSAPDGEDRSTFDTLLDLVVYAPIGLALDARTVLPTLASRGRDQVSLLKVVAQMALRKSEADARRRLHDLAPHLPTDAASATTDLAPAPEPHEDLSSTAVTATDDADVPAPPHDATPPVPDEADLGIPGYDSLSASQIVPRLSALSPDELGAVARHESAHRNRRTIVNRVAQLRGE